MWSVLFFQTMWKEVRFYMRTGSPSNSGRKREGRHTSIKMSPAVFGNIQPSKTACLSTATKTTFGVFTVCLSMADNNVGIIYGTHSLLLAMCITLFVVAWNLETLLLLFLQIMSFAGCVALVALQRHMQRHDIAMHIFRACCAALALLALLYVIWIQHRFPEDESDFCRTYAYRSLVMAAALAILSLILQLYQLFEVGHLHTYLKNHFHCCQNSRSSVELFTERHQDELFIDEETQHRSSDSSDDVSPENLHTQEEE